jgi:enoyl-[acyl-carrier protein] reductase I
LRSQPSKGPSLAEIAGAPGPAALFYKNEDYSDMMASGQRGMGLDGRNVVVLGVADESSLAWAIAKRFAEHGANVFIGYQQKFFSRVRLLLKDSPAVQGDRCDVLVDSEMSNFFGRFRDNPVDVLVHGIAFAPGEMFTEPPSETTPDGFCQSLTISAHSLCKVVRFAKPSLRNWGSVMTLTYQASERAEASYGMMGVAKSALESAVRYLALELGCRKIRVNAISAGPVETVAATGIMGAFLRNPDALDRQRARIFRKAIEAAQAEGGYPDAIALAKGAWKHFQEIVAQRCAIEETVSKEDVADCALFLGSDYSRKITGQVIHVDCGLSTANAV